LLYMIRIMMISIIYMFVALRSHMHMSDVTNMLFIIFYIKLVLNLPKILTCTPSVLNYKKFCLFLDNLILLYINVYI
jgi:hypothetical protein